MTHLLSLRHGGGALLAAAGAATSFALPDPVNVITLLASVGLGVGIGAGSGVAAYRERTGRARVAMIRITDEALRESLQGQLATALNEITDLQQDMHRLRGEVADKQAAADAARAAADAAQAELTEFSLAWLAEHGHIQRPT